MVDPVVVGQNPPQLFLVFGPDNETVPFSEVLARCLWQVDVFHHGLAGSNTVLPVYNPEFLVHDLGYRHWFLCGLGHDTESLFCTLVRHIYEKMLGLEHTAVFISA